VISGTVTSLGETAARAIEQASVPHLSRLLRRTTGGRPGKAGAHYRIEARGALPVLGRMVCGPGDQCPEQVDAQVPSRSEPESSRIPAPAARSDHDSSSRSMRRSSSR
jgi:hypothetical protein